ncbi:MAG: class I SAM-dependent methyltransferase [Candidatus Lokiarchaeota archaeon]|nr:class I SAM-dependent methyltransferase [Candidatus Lokiarchaeota archaeon]
MYEEIIPLLKCPNCDTPLHLIDSALKNGEIIEGKLKCNCDEIWEIRDGVLDFRVEEQESVNRWSELTKDMSFEELDEMILSKTPQNQQELTLKTIEDIINYLNVNKPDFAVDIATGRGMLLNELVKELKHEFHLVCADLSYVVLKADREKIQKYNPKIKVSFVSCDATNLPFLDNSYDLVLSFVGISNMGNLIPKALKETFRVLKRNCKLLNGTFIIEENSEGYKVLKKFFGEQDSEGFEKFLLANEVEKFHKDAGFKEAEFKMIGESIGEKNELDLLPFEGEWFSIGNVYAKKV